MLYLPYFVFPYITNIPLELLALIFTSLDARSLCICKQVCRFFLHVIQDTPALQYITELELAGMVDEPLCPLSTAEKLGRLRRLQHMRCHTKLVRGRTIPYYYLKPFQVAACGLLVQCDDKDGINFFQFPCPFLGNEEREWTIDRTKINLRIEDLCVDASQDVLIVVGYSLTCDLTGHKPAMFRILSISQDGSPHPLAARSQIFLDNGQSKWAQIEGDLLALLITTEFRKRYGRIDVWDWKTGGCLWTLQTDLGYMGFASFNFLNNHNIYALLDDSVYMFELPTIVNHTGSPTVLTLDDAPCILCMPVIDKQTWAHLSSVNRCDRPRRDARYPFYPSAKRDLFTPLVSTEGSWAEAFVIPMPVMQCWLKETDTMEAQEWSQRFPRIHREGLPYCASAQGMQLTVANVEHTKEGRPELRVDFMDYSLGWRRWNGESALWGCGWTYTARIEARPALEDFRGGDLIIIPDHAILQEYVLEETEDPAWQIYHMVPIDAN